MGRRVCSSCAGFGLQVFAFGLGALCVIAAAELEKGVVRRAVGNMRAALPSQGRVHGRESLGLLGAQQPQQAQQPHKRAQPLVAAGLSKRAKLAAASSQRRAGELQFAATAAQVSSFDRVPASVLRQSLAEASLAPDVNNNSGDGTEIASASANATTSRFNNAPLPSFAPNKNDDNNNELAPPPQGQTWRRNVSSINGTVDLSQYEQQDVDRLYGDALLVYFKNFNQ